MKQPAIMSVSPTRLVTLSLLFVVGCGGQSLAVDRAATYYLQYNLRANGNAAISINYWQHTNVLPVCTPVQVEQAAGRRITFTANGERYTYTMHRTSRLDLMTHFNRTFGPGCPNVASFSAIDQQGIGAAMPLVGMSRAGVIAAVGYPPDHRTATLEQPTWTYWGTQGGVSVTFAGDTVQTIQGGAAEPAVVVALQGGVGSPASPPAGAPATPGGIEIREHDDSQTVAVTTEATVVVTDSDGYPVPVPESAIGRACNPQAPCHEALACVNGLCQAPP